MSLTSRWAAGLLNKKRSPFPSGYKTQLEKLFELHDQFAEAIKLVEQLEFEVDYTSLNDSRYALRAIVDLIRVLLEEPIDKEKFDDHYTTARHALNVAWHDIVDIAYTEFKLYLDEISRRYGADIISELIDVSECKEMIYLLEDEVRKTRQNRTARREIYSKITSEHLEETLRLFRAAQDCVPAAIVKKRRQRTSDFFMFVVPILSIVSIVVIVIANLEGLKGLF